MNTKKKLLILSILLGLIIVLYMVYNLPNRWEYAIEKRGIKVGVILIVGCSIAYSSLVFQTLTANKILTPSILGVEVVYLLFQSILVFIYGHKSSAVLSDFGNFSISILCMVGYAFMVLHLMFRKAESNLYQLLLMGLILGSLLHTVSSFIQMILDPNEFLLLQSSMFATFSNMNFDLVNYAVVLLAICMIIGYYYFYTLDALVLGRENAIGLGIDYLKVVRLYLIITTTLVAVSTALVGPITFLGVLITNLTYVLFKTYKHSILITACCLISCLVILSGQLLVEHIFAYKTTISIIINFVGGVYFLFLLLRTKRI